MSDVILAASGLGKAFRNGGLDVSVLSAVDLEVRPAKPSPSSAPCGSGKSTLLHLLGGLDSPTAGKVRLMGRDFSALGEVDRGDWRNKHLGFVVQFHHLLAEFCAGKRRHAAADPPHGAPGGAAGGSGNAHRRRPRPPP